MAMLKAASKCCAFYARIGLYQRTVKIGVRGGKAFVQTKVDHQPGRLAMGSVPTIEPAPPNPNQTPPAPN